MINPRNLFSEQKSSFPLGREENGHIRRPNDSAWKKGEDNCDLYVFHAKSQRISRKVRRDFFVLFKF